MRRYLVLLGALAIAGLVAFLLTPVGPTRQADTTPEAPTATVEVRATPVHQVRVVRTFPHDRQAFTQGLIYRDGVLFESTGLYGQSSLREVTLETGEVRRRHDVPRQYFAEGLTDWGGSLVQLTWTTGVAFVYDRATFRETSQFRYTGEGWGLTRTERHLVMSDGSATLRVLDPATFAEVRRVQVRDEHGPVAALNELEMVRGVLFANVWQSERIATIDLESGRLTGWLDLMGLLPASERARVDVMNGIAYDEKGGRLFVTGKWWPTMFQIEVVR
jgi:glutamine cyclotransferase